MSQSLGSHVYKPDRCLPRSWADRLTSCLPVLCWYACSPTDVFFWLRLSPVMSLVPLCCLTFLTWSTPDSYLWLASASSSCIPSWVTDGWHNAIHSSPYLSPKKATYLPSQRFHGNKTFQWHALVNRSLNSRRTQTQPADTSNCVCHLITGCRSQAFDCELYLENFTATSGKPQPLVPLEPLAELT